MNLYRFFVPDLALPDPRLGASESQHAMKVLRCQLGDRVLAFDGRGTEALCRVTDAAKNSVRIEIIERLSSNRELPCPVTLLVSLPKGDRQKTLVEMVTQLGVTRFIPLVTSRGVAQPTQSALERLRRSVIEACKQCGRNYLMELTDPVSVEQLPTLDILPVGSSVRWFAHPYNENNVFTPSHCELPKSPVSTSIAIGPEGGFTDHEAAAFTANRWTRVTLGRRMLRVETAAIALVSVVAQWMEAVVDNSSRQ